MQYIIYFALIAAAAAVTRTSPGRALVGVYLPVLLLLPDCYHAMTPGLPDPSFNQAAILPIIAIAAMRYGPEWRVSVADMLMIGFAGFVAYSEFNAAGYSEAQNLMFAMISSVVAPYFAARLCIARENLHVAAAKKFALLLATLAVVGFYEARFGMNPFHHILGAFFPGQGYGWVTTFRHGIARVAGPYSHAILAGIMMAIAYRFQRWLEWGGHWEPRFSRFPALPWSKARILTVALVIGSLMTVARGPWLGALLGGAIMFVGRARNRKQALALLVGVGIAVAIPAYIGFSSYLDIKPGMEMTASQESALYRKELMDRYMDIALDHAILGWGRNTWPQIAGMSSIDNYYLLLSLMHGVVATLFLVGLMGWMGIRLLIRGMSAPVGHNSLEFTFLGIILVVFLSLATVYLGENVMPAFFFILGWAEGHLQQGRLTSDPSSTPAPSSSSAPIAPFRHILT